MNWNSHQRKRIQLGRRDNKWFCVGGFARETEKARPDREEANEPSKLVALQLDLAEIRMWTKLKIAIISLEANQRNFVLLSPPPVVMSPLAIL